MVIHDTSGFKPIVLGCEFESSSQLAFIPEASVTDDVRKDSKLNAPTSARPGELRDLSDRIRVPTVHLLEEPWRKSEICPARRHGFAKGRVHAQSAHQALG